MIRSIRFRLTLWYVGILAVILSAFGAFFYSAVQHNWYQRTDDLLISHADGISDAIFSFWEAEWDEQLEAQRSNPNLAHSGTSQAFQKIAENGQLSDLIARWADDTGELDNIERPLRLLSASGKILRSSDTFNEHPVPVTPDLLNKIQANKTLFETFQIGSSRFRLMTRPVIEAGQLMYIIQSQTTLDYVDHSLKELRKRLWGTIPVVVLIASLGGWFLAALAFKPVGLMIDEVQQLQADELHKRLNTPHTADELERLALTFNNLLERLESSFRRLRQFSAAASHELRTPLTIMKGELEVALRKPRENAEYQRVLKTQLEALDEMTSIVEQLLMLSRSDSLKTLEWQPLDLKQVCEKQCENFQSIFKARQLQFEFHAEPSIFVRGEKRLLERLLSNLLDNAAKHTPAHGKIQLTLKQEAKEACLSIQDTGSGISDEELPHIFDRFFSRPSSASSTGLGLGLCRWIVEAHHGHMEVESKLSQGSTFHVFLPLYTASF